MCYRSGNGYYRQANVKLIRLEIKIRSDIPYGGKIIISNGKRCVCPHIKHCAYIFATGILSLWLTNILLKQAEFASLYDSNNFD